MMPNMTWPHRSTRSMKGRLVKVSMLVLSFVKLPHPAVLYVSLGRPGNGKPSTLRSSTQSVRMTSQVLLLGIRFSDGDQRIRANGASGSKHPGGAALLRRLRRPTGGAREGDHPLASAEGALMLAPSQSDPEASGVASAYVPPARAYDELMGPDGEVRPHWRPFLARMNRWGDKEMERRWGEARHLIHENGVSYNVYGDERGMERPWSLSPVPVLLAADDWAQLAAAVAQRGRLMDRLLADLYGPQRALVEGWLPPGLGYRNPSFLRPLPGVPGPRGRWLPLYAVDVVRGPDGEFRALADRTQAPTGAGYALENRIVIARALPDLFRECNVERLALFFRTLQDTLARLAPHNRDNPRVVLLTPGPHNASYFEQAYLAQYLGYTLAGGGDLTVRDDRVFLKTLSGLQPVDVILRRVNDDFCDPLELRPETVLGVPGLVQAVRQGMGAGANPLGPRLLQTPPPLPDPPQGARPPLSGGLLLPAVGAFWGGGPPA